MKTILIKKTSTNYGREIKIVKATLSVALLEREIYTVHTVHIQIKTSTADGMKKPGKIIKLIFLHQEWKNTHP